MKRLVVASVALLVLVLPAVARAGLVEMHVETIPLGGRALQASPRVHFNMFAPHWTGSGGVEYRTHHLHGGWSAWIAADADVAPDGGTGRWHDGDLVWTGASDRVEFRTHGSVSRLRAYELWSRRTSVSERRLSESSMPPIVTRAQWQANERIVRARPRYAKSIRLAIVHHTAGTNDYTPAQAAAIVRGIELYHVKGNGWNDIGYNFLVDRFGTIYEGRGGGITRNVIGAHAEGFNVGTVGVALIGNFSTATPPEAMRDALVRLLAWRLDVAHLDPLSTVAYTSGGNYKFRAGRVVILRAISGHRDTGPSECPGNGAFRLLPSIAARVAATGLPKIYSPVVAGLLGGPIRFEARLSSPLPWTVTVTNTRGATVAHGAGTSRLVDWTWRSPPGKGTYGWAIASPGALAASGTLGSGAAPPPSTLSLTELAAAPAVLTPAPDGTGATSTVSFTLSAPAQVTARVLDPAGTVVQTALDEQRSAGPNTFALDGADLADGAYSLRVVAKPSAGRSAAASVGLLVDRTLTGLAASPPAFSPNGDGVQDSTTLSFALSQQVPVRVEIESQGVVVATLLDTQLPAGQHSLAWDGTDGAGTQLPDGAYTAVVTVTDALGRISIPVALTVDTTAPTLAIVDPHQLEFTLSEPATVTVVVNQTTRLVVSEPAGTFSIPFTGSVAQLSAQAQDAAGNVSAVVTA
jgi:flagellar hook assembly protein FlgD